MVLDISFDSDFPLKEIVTTIEGPDPGVVTEDDYTETDNGDGTYTYEAIYSPSQTGQYTATLGRATNYAYGHWMEGVSNTVTVSSVIPDSEGGQVSTITASGEDYLLHVFESDGTFSIDDEYPVDVLVVGGGGGGGGSTDNSTGSGGGGGAGGLIYKTTTEGSMSNGFEDMSSWTVYNGGQSTGRVYEGSYSFAGSGNSNEQARWTPFPNGEQVSLFEYHYQETGNSHGQGVRLVNSNGNYEGGTATDNPEFDVDFANTSGEIDSGSGYDDWVRVTWDFDWTNSEVTITFNNLADNYSHTETFTLKQGVDISRVELWNYNGENWEGGSDLDGWWDELSFRASLGSVDDVPITVGDGGAGSTSTGSNGDNSEFGTITAIGGGGGGRGENTNQQGRDGGSGGGSGGDSSTYSNGGTGTQPSSIDGGFGNDGGGALTDSGDQGGGGGGAGEEGTDSDWDGSTNIEGHGGDGLDYSDEFGTTYGENGWFAGGGGGNNDRDGNESIGGQGGGGSSKHNSYVEDGMANTGGGGAGGGKNNAASGGDGGSGIVIVRVGPL